MNYAIKADGLGKRYYLNRGFGSLLKKGFNELVGRNRITHEEFWALKDISFAIKAGEALGVIGRNGAGKSTLLKVLSGVTRQTEGDFEINGSVGALIEIGAGFHPELSGRENIYLNASILGMRKRAIKAKFDDIVAFSELEQFIDTPVKRYSSGMFVRLGFSVAIHTDPDILLIDEVLAVGDFSFRKKCLNKIAEFRDRGKTFFLVSHDMVNIENVCDRVIYMREGKVEVDDEPAKAIAKYYEEAAGRDVKSEKPKRMLVTDSTGDIQILSASLKNGSGEDGKEFVQGSNLKFEIEYNATTRIHRPKIQLAIRKERQRIGVTNTHRDADGPKEIIGRGRLSCVFNELPLVTGHYFVDLVISDGVTGADLCLIRNLEEFTVKSSSSWRIGSTDLGLVHFNTQWVDDDGKEF
jgi:ABC-type polysaccharide/polyol phosphate transport system ATPase subunit